MSNQNEGRTRLSRITLGLLAAVIAPILTLASLELLLRLWALVGGSVHSVEVAQAEQTRSILRRVEPALAEPYPDRIFDLRASRRQVFSGEDFTIEMTINSKRLRDREHSIAKPTGTYRILALGDSFTFGWGVDVTDTWWAELGRLMARQMAPTPVEIINLGVYDYTFDQQVQRLQEFGLVYHPDVIVADFFYPHVVTIATHIYQAETSRPWPRILDSTIYVDDEGLLRFGQPLPLEGLRLHSMLADFVLSRIKRIQYKYSEAGRLNEFELLRPERQHDFDHAWMLTRQAYQKLMQLSRELRIPVVLFEIPRDMQVWPGWKRDGARLTQKAPFHSRLPQQRFGEICRDLRMECFDLLPGFLEEAVRDPKEPLFYPVDVHLTPRGQKLAGEMVFDYLIAHQLPRGRKPTVGR